MGITVERLEAAGAEMSKTFKRLGFGFWNVDDAEEHAKQKRQRK